MAAKWTDEELQRLRELYGTMSSWEIAKHFPGRKRTALMERAHKLGLKGRPATRPSAPKDRPRDRRPRKPGWGNRPLSDYR